MLNDDVLLAIFNFCVADDGNQSNQDTKRAIERWQSLIHVCRRWRSLVFGSPSRLNLRLVCTPRTPVKKRLDVWPSLRLQIQGTILSTSTVDNILVALGHRDRVFRIDLLVNLGFQWNAVLAAMQVPFPALTDLLIQSRDHAAPVIPDTFLGGSAPSLRYLELEYISFPGIPKLLLSATHLVYLYLHHIPNSGYISPEAIVTCLSVLTSLDTFSLRFKSSQSRPDRESQRPPPITRSILPDLTTFCFKGVSEYLEDLVARIDAPRLHNVSITFLHQIHSDTPHLVQFIHRTPRFEEPNKAIVRFGFNDVVEIRLLSYTSDGDGELIVEISRGESNQRVSSIGQVCTTCLPPLSAVENLRIYSTDLSVTCRKYDVENNQWLELLRPFTAVKSLCLSNMFQSGIASALGELVGARTTEILPSLQNVFLGRFEPSRPFQEAIGQFIAARQLSGHPITVSPSRAPW